MTPADAQFRRGVAYGLGAYGIWGFLPLYFRLIDSVGAGEIVAQRILWSVALLGIVLVAMRRVAAFRATFANRRTMLLLLASATLIGVNWLVYVWAVNAGHVLETSLGYFLNPLVNVVMGVAVLKERLNRAQTAAVLLAAAGVAILAVSAAGGLWISLALALSFATYGLIRKIVPAEALEGLAVETLLLAPVAAGYVIWLAAHGDLGFGSDPTVSLLIALSGILTAAPLLMFAAAARRMPYSTLGLLQYIAPTIRFLLAVLVFGEAMTTAHMLCFAAIWAGLAIYAVDGVRRARRGSAAVTP